jgi:hypothetical protein
MHTLLAAWQRIISSAPALVPAVVRSLLPLVQQLQACSLQLFKAAAEPAAQSSTLPLALFAVHEAAAGVLLELAIECPEQSLLSASVSEQVQSLLQRPAAVALLLQNLAACTAELHKHHVAYRRAQRQQQQQQQPSKQHRADLLVIPAFHQQQDMLQLLPGGQAYLDAAAALESAGEARCQASEGQKVYWFRMRTRRYCSVLSNILLLSCFQPDQQQSTVLSAAAVRLVLQLQLLAAAEHQQWQQQQQQQLLHQEGEAAAGPSDAVGLLVCSTQLLHTQIRAVAQSSSSCLPPEVLQQAGLQLLQALAAPLQQVQLCDDNYLLGYAKEESRSCLEGSMSEACHVLVTAACGPAAALTIGGELQTLANTAIVGVL